MTDQTAFDQLREDLYEAFQKYADTVNGQTHQDYQLNFDVTYTPGYAIETTFKPQITITHEQQETNV